MEPVNRRHLRKEDFECRKITLAEFAPNETEKITIGP